MNDRDKYILQCIVDVWADDGELKHYGDVSYKEIVQTLERNGLTVPSELAVEMKRD